MGVPCTKTEYCDTLVELSQHNKLRPGRGLAFHQFVNITTGKKTRALIAYHLNVDDAGLYLNFCPWCGFDFSKRKDWVGPVKKRRLKT